MNFKRILVLIMTFAMVIGACAPAIQAFDGVIDTEHSHGDKKELVYVSLGDSMTNGYGLDGYDAEAGVYDYGYDSYANVFAKMLGEVYNANVTHHQLACSATRPEDINFLLRLDYDNPEVIALLDRYPEDDLVCWGCGDHEGVAYEDIVYCAVCKWDPEVFPQFDLPGWGVQRDDGKSVDDYEAWWTLVQGKKWNELIGYGDFWTWKELVEDYRFGTVATYIKSVYGTDAEKARAEELMASKPAKPRDDASNGVETAYVAKHYQEAVKNADVISFAIGNGNFGVWLMGRITTALMDYDGIAANGVYDIDEPLALCTPEVRALIEKTLVEIEPMIDQYVGTMMGDLDPDKKQSIEDVCTYGVVSFMINYASTLERILELNPDVEIVMPGLMNTYAGDDELAEEGTVTIGNILDVLFPPLNAYIAALPTTMQLAGNELWDNAKFYYAEEYTIECLIQEFGDENFYNWVGVARDRFVTGVIGECDCGNNCVDAEACTDFDEGIFWELLHGFDMGGVTIQYLTKDDIKAYCALDDSGKVAYAMENKDKAGSIAVYLAIEDAICKSGKLAPVTLSTLTGLKLGDPAILDKALGNFSAEQEKIIDDYKPAAEQGLIDAGLEGLYDETDINDMSMILSLPVALSNALWTDQQLCSMLAVVARNKLGNGLGAHPTSDGHKALATAMCESYVGGWTAQKQTILNAYEYTLEYYDEAYELAYKYADTKGYTNKAISAINKVLNRIDKVDLSDNKMTAAFRADLQRELDALVPTLNELKDVIATDKAKDVPGLVDTLRGLKDDVKTHIKNIYELCKQAGYDVTTIVIIPLLEELVTVLDEYFDILVAKIIENIKPLLKGIYGELKDIIEIIIKINLFLGGALDQLIAIINEVVDTFNFVYNLLVDVFGTIENALVIAGKITALLIDYIRGVPGLVNNIKNLMLNIYDIIVSVYGETHDALETAKAVHNYLVSVAKYIKDKIMSSINGASKADYEITIDSHYVALGNAPYASDLAEMLFLGDKYDKVPLSGNYINKLAGADLVSVKFDNGEFYMFVMEQLMGYVPTILMSNEQFLTYYNQFPEEFEMYFGIMGIDLTASAPELDWSKYLDEETRAILSERVKALVTNITESNLPQTFSYDIGPMIAEIALPEGAELEAVIEINVSEVIAYALEVIAYASFEASNRVATTLDNIYSVAPNATVVVTGILNPLGYITPIIDMIAPEYNAYMEILDEAFEIINLPLYACAVANPNTIFVPSEDAAVIYDALNAHHDHYYHNVCTDTVCAICGEVRVAPGHVFGEWVTVLEPTTEAEGKQERTCTVCGYVESAPIDKLPNNDPGVGPGDPIKPEPPTPEEGLSTAAIVGIAVGSIALACGVGALVYWFFVKKKVVEAAATAATTANPDKKD